MLVRVLVFWCKVRNAVSARVYLIAEIREGWGVSKDLGSQS